MNIPIVSNNLPVEDPMVLAPGVDSALNLHGGVMSGQAANPLALDIDESHLSKVSELLPIEKYQLFLSHWHQALHNSGTPLDFADQHSYEKATVWIDQNPYLTVSMIGIDHEYRRKVIGNQIPYQSKFALDSYNRNFTASCPLDAGLLRALDAEDQHSGVKSNALSFIGDDFVWLVNKFPYNIGDAMILPINHDDLSSRADFSTEGRVWTKARSDQTRGAIISQEYLAAVVFICDNFHQTGHRNHALDGMSIPLHDHFKTQPEDSPGFAVSDFLIRQDLTEYPGVQLYFPEGTPFATLGITGSDKLRLVQIGTDILEKMERADEIFTLIYHKGHLLITPRLKQKFGPGNPDGWTGSTVGAHGIEDPSKSPEHLRRVNEYVAKVGEFNWSEYLEHQEILDRQNIDRVGNLPSDRIGLSNLVSLNYRSINFSQPDKWGGGSLLEEARSDLVPESVQKLYQRTIGFQDKRDDPGHTETVVYLACVIAKLSGASEREVELAGLAAVLHDAGYAKIDDITARYASIERARTSASLTQQNWALSADREIRLLHQEQGAKLAEQLLAGHPDLESIKEIILDHDTRQYNPRTKAESYMRDADMLARVTWPTVQSMLQRNPDLASNSAQIVRILESQMPKSQKTGFYNYASLEIARIELVASVLKLYENNQEQIPAYFKAEYINELEARA